MEVKLALYNDDNNDAERDIAVCLIMKFWEEHNSFTPNEKEAFEDLKEWTKKGHALYFIDLNGEHVGFLHLGSRGCEADWLEDIFVLPRFRGKGVGSSAIRLAEDIVREYSESLYIEAAARNTRAIRLYHRIGYNCLNTITVRKDFRPERYEAVGKERIAETDFDVKQYKK